MTRRLVLCLALALAAPAAAEAYQKLVLEVGSSKVIGGFGGICDDPSVATITLDTNATVTALKAGTTLCSSRVGGAGGGIRMVYRVEVVAPPAGEPAPGSPGRTGR
jgi:hypothetical protein